MSQKVTTIYIARHGETELNLARRIQGHYDSPLTNKGTLQAQELSQALKHIHFDAIFSSDLLRAQRTAEIIGLERNLAVVTNELLREKTYGRLEGKSYEEFERQYQKLWDEFIRLGNSEQHLFKVDKQAENDEEAMGRYLTFLREIAFSHPGKNNPYY